MSAVWVLALLGVALGALLGWAARRYRREEAPLVEAIDRILPQTQCGQCGFPGCRPYAEAIANGTADINQCPPGGSDGIRALAALLGREPKPLDTTHGVEKPRVLAWIDEADCIGCTKCIIACPVDAIIGAPQRMHTVLEAECTGCELCIAPCPVDCIELRPVAGLTPRPAAKPSRRIVAVVDTSPAR
jgi:electron transport complex protein RnfB